MCGAKDRLYQSFEHFFLQILSFLFFIAWMLRIYIKRTMSVFSVCYFARFSLLFGVVGGSSERIIRIIFFQSERETIYRQTLLYRMAENYCIYVSIYRGSWDGLYCCKCSFPVNSQLRLLVGWSVIIFKIGMEV